MTLDKNELPDMRLNTSYNYYNSLIIVVKELWDRNICQGTNENGKLINVIEFKRPFKEFHLVKDLLKVFSEGNIFSVSEKLHDFVFTVAVSLLDVCKWVYLHLNEIMWVTNFFSTLQYLFQWFIIFQQSDVWEWVYRILLKSYFFIGKCEDVFSNMAKQRRILPFYRSVCDQLHALRGIN